MCCSGPAISRCASLFNDNSISDLKSLCDFTPNTLIPLSGLPPMNDTLPGFERQYIFALRNAAQICSPNVWASVSRTYEFTTTLRPANLWSAPAIAFCCSKVSRLGAVNASSCAASFSALAALSSTIDTSLAVSSRISVSTFAILIPTKNSPKTPMATSAHPAKDIANFALGGSSGEWIIPLQKPSQSVRYSNAIGTTSTVTPMNTSNAQPHNQCSSEHQDVSKAVSAILKADSSMRRCYDRAEQILLTQILAVFLLYATAIVYVLWGPAQALRFRPAPAHRPPPLGSSPTLLPRAMRQSIGRSLVRALPPSH